MEVVSKPSTGILIQFYRNNFLVMKEIYISSKDRNINSFCNSTYKIINMEALNPLFPAMVAKLSSRFIVNVLNRCVFKKGEFCF